MRNALSKRTVSALTFPNDLQFAPVAEDPYRHVGPARPPASRPRRRSPGRPVPTIPTAAQISTPARKSRCSWCRRDPRARSRCWPSPRTRQPHRQDLARQGRRCRRPSAHDRAGSDCWVPDRAKRRWRLRHALHGRHARSPTPTHLPGAGQPSVVQIDVDPSLVGSGCPSRDRWSPIAQLALSALLPILDRHSGPLVPGDRAGEMQKWRRSMARARDPDEIRSQPQYLDPACSTSPQPATRSLPAIPGQSQPGRHVIGRSGTGREFYLSGNLATMAPGLPYAIVMQHAFPDRQ